MLAVFFVQFLSNFWICFAIRKSKKQGDVGDGEGEENEDRGAYPKQEGADQFNNQHAGEQDQDPNQASIKPKTIRLFFYSLTLLSWTLSAIFPQKVTFSTF